MEPITFQWNQWNQSLKKLVNARGNKLGFLFSSKNVKSKCIYLLVLSGLVPTLKPGTGPSGNRFHF